MVVGGDFDRKNGGDGGERERERLGDERERERKRERELEWCWSNEEEGEEKKLAEIGLERKKKLLPNCSSNLSFILFSILTPISTFSLN